ncbi:shikimate dehydrogenase [Candidatus Latescibacterota bacterium]
MIISGKTSVFGVIGHPIAHTLSPRMHNRAISEMGIDAVYVPFNVLPEFLPHAIKSIISLGVKGMNITVPYKTEVIKYLDNLSDVARAVGAVNTIINDNSVLKGDNTDVYGFEKCLEVEGGLLTFPDKVCILGAGGAARGVVYACLIRKEVREVTVINRTFSKAKKLAEELFHVTGKAPIPMKADEETFEKILPNAGLIINTTTIGMHPDVGLSAVRNSSLFHEGQIACDIIYNPLKTKFLSDAASRGAKTVGGLAMLAYQGARSLSLWTGKEAPVEVMLDSLKEKLGAR